MSIHPEVLGYRPDESILADPEGQSPQPIEIVEKSDLIKQLPVMDVVGYIYILNKQIDMRSNACLTPAHLALIDDNIALHLKKHGSTYDDYSTHLAQTKPELIKVIDQVGKIREEAILADMIERTRIIYQVGGTFSFETSYEESIFYKNCCNDAQEIMEGYPELALDTNTIAAIREEFEVTITENDGVDY